MAAYTSFSASFKPTVLIAVFFACFHPAFSFQTSLPGITQKPPADDSLLKKTKLFNDGCNAYRNGNYLQALECFDTYKKQWPDEIHGYYWNLRTHMSLDPTLEKGLAFKDALEVIRIAGKEENKHKAVLFTAYQYLLDYYTKVQRDTSKEIFYLRKIESLDPRTL